MTATQELARKILDSMQRYQEIAHTISNTWAHDNMEATLRDIETLCIETLAKELLPETVAVDEGIAPRIPEKIVAPGVTITVEGNTLSHDMFTGVFDHYQPFKPRDRSLDVTLTDASGMTYRGTLYPVSHENTL